MDTGLKTYEAFFDDNKLAIIPLANAIRYLKDNTTI
jgi:hypothetical protein